MRNPRNVHAPTPAGEVEVRLSVTDAAAILHVHQWADVPREIRSDGRLLSNEGEVALRLALRRAAARAS